MAREQLPDKTVQPVTALHDNPWIAERECGLGEAVQLARHEAVSCEGEDPHVS